MSKKCISMHCCIVYLNTTNKHINGGEEQRLQHSVKYRVANTADKIVEIKKTKSEEFWRILYTYN